MIPSSSLPARRLRSLAGQLCHVPLDDSPAAAAAAAAAPDGGGICILDPPPHVGGGGGDPEQTAAIVSAFKKDGVVCIPGVFSAAECAVLRERIDRLFDAQFGDLPPAAASPLPPSAAATAEELRRPVGQYTVQKCYLVDRVFARLFARPVIFSLMEAVFGPGSFQQCGNNSLRTSEGAHRAEQWHVDPPVWPLDTPAQPAQNITLPVRTWH